MKLWWQSQAGLKADQKRIEAVVKRLLVKHKIKEPVEISISIVKDKAMKRLNQRHLQRPGTTDVLSFPLELDKGPDRVTRLGDVVISYPQAQKQAQARGIETAAEIDRLIEHGVKHLLGIHH